MRGLFCYKGQHERVIVLQGLTRKGQCVTGVNTQGYRVTTCNNMSVIVLQGLI